MPAWDRKITKEIHDIGVGSLEFWEQFTRFGIYLYAVALFLMAFLIEANITVLFWFVPPTTAFLITLLLRYIIRRPRPKYIRTKYVPMLQAWSFPSAHAAVAFSFAATLSIIAIQVHPLIGYLASIAAFAVALTISFSRLFVGVHYFSDIVAGALIGILVSITLIPPF